MKKRDKELLKKNIDSWRKFREQRKNQFFLWFSFVNLLLFLKNTFVIPVPLTYRKIFFLSCLVSLFIFKISYKIMIYCGFFLLLFISFLSFSGHIGLVSRLIVYAWGFFVGGGILLAIEMWGKKNDAED